MVSTEAAQGRHALRLQPPNPVPPSPGVMAALYMEYLRVGKPVGITFFQFLAVRGYADPAHDIQGMDDAVVGDIDIGGLHLIAIPQQPLIGALQVKVLLIDFPDRPSTLPVQRYEDLLFSRGIHPTGSMYDYYKEVSLGKMEISGTVHGWLRMPEPYSFYTNNQSGIFGGAAAYPRNAQRMAEDAVKAALANGVVFEPALDRLNKGVVTALFIVHAGRGAEEVDPVLKNGEIWSHKWQVQQPIEVGPGLKVSTYLAVPFNGEVGVCCHELGHLAFQWQDFYDPNGSDDGKLWAGTGDWDLMAGGSWNDNGRKPAHPAALHKIQHGWVDVKRIAFTQGNATDVDVEIPPYTRDSGLVVKITRSAPSFKEKQYLLLENRTFMGFDTALPGEGMMLWRVDEVEEQNAPEKPGLMLIQADGLHELAENWDDGDSGDPFPGSSRRRRVNPTGAISTSFPDQPPSGITLDRIKRSAATGVITLRVRYDGS